MKSFAFTILIMAFLACNTTAKHTTMESFWTDFQRVVVSNDREAVADMTHFPLQGGAVLLENPDTLGLSREQFLQHFDQIFDEKARATIARTTADALEVYLSPKDAALHRLSLPPNTQMYYLSVVYVFDEGLETQTESAVIFYFLKENGVFRFAYLSVVG